MIAERDDRVAASRRRRRDRAHEHRAPRAPTSTIGVRRAAGRASRRTSRRCRASAGPGSRRSASGSRRSRSTRARRAPRRAERGRAGTSASTRQRRATAPGREPADAPRGAATSTTHGEHARARSPSRTPPTHARAGERARRARAAPSRRDRRRVEHDPRAERRSAASAVRRTRFDRVRQQHRAHAERRPRPRARRPPARSGDATRYISTTSATNGSERRPEASTHHSAEVAARRATRRRRLPRRRAWPTQVDGNREQRLAGRLVGAQVAVVRSRDRCRAGSRRRCRRCGARRAPRSSAMRDAGCDVSGATSGPNARDEEQREQPRGTLSPTGQRAGRRPIHLRETLPDLAQLAFHLVDLVAEARRLLETQIACRVVHLVGEALDQAAQLVAREIEPIACAPRSSGRDPARARGSDRRRSSSPARCGSSRGCR